MGDKEIPKCSQAFCRLISSNSANPSTSTALQVYDRRQVPFTGQILAKTSIWQRISIYFRKKDRGMLNRRLLRSLFFATQVIDDVADDMYREEQFQWRSTILGHDFYGSRTVLDHGEGCTNLMYYVKHWLQAHEEAQVMLASILVVVGLWWLVRTVLALLINLVCPLLVVLLAVVLIPQLRAPLLGQNYPAVANVLGNILIKLAENIKNQDCLSP